MVSWKSVRLLPVMIKFPEYESLWEPKISLSEAATVQIYLCVKHFWRRHIKICLQVDKQKFENCMKRRFFYGPSFSLYGGVAGLYDYGPAGCAMKANMVNYWRNHFVVEENMLEVWDFLFFSFFFFVLWWSHFPNIYLFVKCNCFLDACPKPFTFCLSLLTLSTCRLSAQCWPQSMSWRRRVMWTGSVTSWSKMSRLEIATGKTFTLPNPLYVLYVCRTQIHDHKHTMHPHISVLEICLVKLWQVTPSQSWPSAWGPSREVDRC